MSWSSFWFRTFTWFPAEITTENFFLMNCHIINWRRTIIGWICLSWSSIGCVSFWWGSISLRGAILSSWIICRVIRRWEFTRASLGWVIANNNNSWRNIWSTRSWIAWRGWVIRTGPTNIYSWIIDSSLIILCWWISRGSVIASWSWVMGDSPC